jgi:acyl-coenzyme A thioesterase PaaI-like protein
VSESRESRRFRRRMRWFPAYRGTGGRIEYVAGDWKEMRVRLPLSRRTRNLVGTIFGGSLYAAVDPQYMLMLVRLLGPDYVVWDKAASIRFRKPGRSTLWATLRIDDGELEEIRAAVAEHGRVDRHYRVELVDADGAVHAEVEKVVYVAAKANARESGA